MSNFEDHFKSNKGLYMESWQTHFPSLKRVKADFLEVPFFVEEIKQELMGANGNKALGFDGFPLKFAQIFWSNLKGGGVSHV